MPEGAQPDTVGRDKLEQLLKGGLELAQA
jgi:hypothetical protein